MDTVFTEEEAKKANWDCRMCDHNNPKKGSKRHLENCQLCRRQLGIRPSKFELFRQRLIPTTPYGSNIRQTRETIRDEEDEREAQTKLVKEG